MLSEALSVKTAKESYKLWAIITGALMRLMVLMTMANVRADRTAEGSEVRKNVI